MPQKSQRVIFLQTKYKLELVVEHQYHYHLAAAFPSEKRGKDRLYARRDILPESVTL